jgi:hypothetical protein
MVTTSPSDVAHEPNVLVLAGATSRLRREERRYRRADRGRHPWPVYVYRRRQRFGFLHVLLVWPATRPILLAFRRVAAFRSALSAQATRGR